MKLIFFLKCRIPALDSNISEYQYDFKFEGLDNFGKMQSFDWCLYSSYARTASEAKKDIKQRLINSGAFDSALDGVCPYLSGQL
jgi:hypothetical protein